MSVSACALTARVQREEDPRGRHHCLVEGHGQQHRVARGEPPVGLTRAVRATDTSGEGGGPPADW